ncbi:MAG: hypothetical protein ABF254_07685, partial [Octadecabacter sp.]
LLGGLIAFGAFYLVRGDGSSPEPAEIAQPETPQIEAAPVEETAPERLYFLQGVDLESGNITLIMNGELTGQKAMVVTDQAALAAAQNAAFVNAATTDGGTVALMTSGVPPQHAFATLYRDDALIAALTCTTTPCGGYASQDMNITSLLAVAQPLVGIQDAFDSHGEYLATIEAIAQNSNYMFLDLRPNDPFPLEPQSARMELALPTLISLADTTFDTNVASALARTIVEPLLPDGAQISEVVFTTTGEGLVADGDSGTPVLAGGAPIPFPDVKFTSVTVHVEGTATLSDAALDSLSEQPLQRTDYQDAFETFVTERLQSGCADCFSVKMRGDFYDEATVIVSAPENYRLDYYDLREAP